MPSPTLLVTGASGQLGRRVIAHLLQTHRVPAGQIIATTRKPETLADLAAQGVQVRSADFDNPASLVTAFSGAQRLLLISTDALDRPGRRLAQHQAAVAAAVQAGVQHVVYTSMPRPEPGSPIPFAPDHYGTEQALAASPMGWTVLRHSWYMENLFLNLPQVLGSGQWFTAAGEGRVTHVSREDCARADAAALASASTTSASHLITGPETHTTREIAQLAGEVLGRPLAVVQVSPDALAKGMAAAGVPPFLVPLLVSFDVNTAQGRVETVTDAVKALTGTGPQTLRDFLMANRKAFLS
jgi:NAD(P)H dehydrogenase (quinone)